MYFFHLQKVERSDMSVFNNLWLMPFEYFDEFLKHSWVVPNSGFGNLKPQTVDPIEP